MAIRIWTDGAADGNFGTAGNWTGAAAPVTGDTIIVSSTTRAITSGMDQTAILSGTFIVGEKFYGSIGTAASPLKFGGTMGEIRVNAPKSGTINLWPAACTTMVVEDCARVQGAAGFHLYDGNVTTLAVVGGADVLIGALANPTTCILGANDGKRRNLNVSIESGATITTITQFYGTVDNAAAFTTYNGKGGLFRHNGTATGAITTANIEQPCTFLWQAQNGNTGFTLGTLNMFGGTFDSFAHVWNNTITTLTNHGGAVKINNAFTVTTLIEYAAGYVGPTPGTRTTVSLGGK